MVMRIKGIIILEIFFISLFFSCASNQNLKQSEKINKTRISIAPFKYLNETGDFKWLSNAFPETLSTALSFVPEFIMTERSQIEQVIKEQELQLTGVIDEKSGVSIGKILGSQYILLGSYQIYANKIKVNIRMVNVETGQVQPEFSSLYEDYTINIFDLQNKIVEHLLKKCKVNINSSIVQKTNSIIKDSTNIDAYKFYTEGKNLYYLKEYQSAIDMFQEALKIDKNYKMAKSYLAMAYSAQADQFFYKTMSRQANVASKKAGEILKELENEMKDSYLYYIAALKIYENMLSQGELSFDKFGIRQINFTMKSNQDFLNLANVLQTSAGKYNKEYSQKALALNPDSPEANYYYWKYNDGRTDSIYLNTAIDLNPVYIDAIISKAKEYLIKKDYQKAVETISRLKDYNNNLYISYLNFFKTYNIIVIKEEAVTNQNINDLLLALQLNPYEGDTNFLLGECYLRLGKKPDSKCIKYYKNAINYNTYVFKQGLLSYRLGLYYMYAKNYKDAIHFLMLHIDNDRYNEQAHHVSWCYYLLGNINDAIKYGLAACEENNSMENKVMSPDVNMGLFYLIKGDIKQSDYYYNLALNNYNRNLVLKTIKTDINDTLKLPHYKNRTSALKNKLKDLK